MNLTENEIRLLTAIRDSEYHSSDGSKDAIVGTPIWVNCIWDFAGKKLFPGVMASLSKKGLVKTSELIDRRRKSIHDGECCWITSKGWDALELSLKLKETAMTEATETVTETTETPKAPKAKRAPRKKAVTADDLAKAVKKSAARVAKANAPAPKAKKVAKKAAKPAKKSAATRTVRVGKLHKISSEGLRAESRRKTTYDAIKNGMDIANFSGDRGDLDKLIRTGKVEVRA